MEQSLPLIADSCELSSVPPAELYLNRVRGAAAAAGSASRWVFYLPDCVEMLRAELSGDDSFGIAPYTVRAVREEQDGSVRYRLLILNSERYFVPACSTAAPGGAQAVLWVRIAACDAARLLVPQHAAAEFAAFGLLANQLRDNRGVFGLYSLVKLRLSSDGSLWFSDSEDVPAPHPRLTQERLAAALQKPGGFTELNEVCLPQTVLHFLKSIHEGDTAGAAAALDKHAHDWSNSGAAMFAAGKLSTALGRHARAADFFHRAQLLDHPRALAEEWEAISRITKPFREQFSAEFEHIRRGERFRALTTLRQAAEQHPLTGCAVLSYCLRGAGVPQEGLAAAQKSLSLNPNQADVLNNKWSYETELSLDSEAAETARRHVERYPTDPAGNINAIDSALLLGNLDQAKNLVRRYQVIAPGLERWLEQIFKVCEQREEWQELAQIFDRYASLLRAPTVRVLTLHGETLLEVERFDEAFAQFERALAADPSDGQLVTGYARALARAGREDQAEGLLRTVLGDPRRRDIGEHRVFIVTTLAEIMRRTGRPAEALELFEKELATDIVELSAKVGPLPALERIESLIAVGDEAAASAELLRLLKLWPSDPFVRDLARVLSLEV